MLWCLHSYLIHAPFHSYLVGFLFVYVVCKFISFHSASGKAWTCNRKYTEIHFPSPTKLAHADTKSEGKWSLNFVKKLMKESEKHTCGKWSLLFLLFIYYYAEPLWFKLKDNYSDKSGKIETCSLVDPAGADRTRTHLLHTADLSHGLHQQKLGKEKGIPMWIILKNDFSHQR